MTLPLELEPGPGPYQSFFSKYDLSSFIRNIADYQKNTVDVFPHTMDFIMLVKLIIAPCIDI